MFRDASEELERLQAELLSEDEPEMPEPPPEEDVLYEEDPLDPFFQEEEPVYQNYANGYRAYNSDTSDQDLEDYSEQVRQGRSSRGGCCLAVIAVFLALILAVLVIAWFAYQRGYLG